MLRWYVVETKHAQEQLAAREIKPFEVYLPTYDRRITHARRVSVEARPLFPSYLFCRFDTGAPWQRILHTRGVAGVLGAPTFISDRVVAEIRGRMNPPVGVRIRAGEKVRILGGSWDGQEGLFSADAGERVRVLLSMMGRDVEKEFNRANVVRR